MQRILHYVKDRQEQHVVSNLFQVEEKSTRHGGELVASVLKSHDVREVFTLCGGHISPILVACEGLGIKVVDTRHEVTAVFAADAVARLRQSIGVVAVTAGPGLTNTITAIKNAQMAESPILLIGGAAPTLLKNRGALQDIDQLVLFRPLCKYTARVTRLRDIVPTLRAAIQAAKSGTPGPVFVEFPVDVLYPYETVIKECGFVPNPKGIKMLINAYLMCHVSRQFGGAWNQQDISPLPVNTPFAKSEEINKLVEMLLSAKKPLLLMGSQASLAPVKADELKSIVESLGIPTYLGGMCRGLLGKDSPLQMRQNRRDALKECDLVILAGTICDFRLSYGRVLSPKSRIVCINRNRSQLTKNEKIFWNATQLIQADVASTLKKLHEKITSAGKRVECEEWLNALTEREQNKEASNARKMDEVPKDGNLNPLKVLAEMDKVLPDDTILVADGGDFVGSAAYIVRPRGPLQWLDPGAFGTLGVGGGFALGAKLVYPERPVVIIYGDGSCGYSIMEYDTFVRHKLSVISVIGNDACWSQIAREQVPMFNSSVAVDLAHSKYHEVAEALGARGVLLDKSGEESVGATFSEAFDHARQRESTVINVIIGKTDFREGSISV
uniref:2-hydroxyacyl-CoA lyase 2 n=1 Tax=Steinernema glaseri TaxID=37863 RepID=A0A1I7YDC2_9BILA